MVGEACTSISHEGRRQRHPGYEGSHVSRPAVSRSSEEELLEGGVEETADHADEHEAFRELEPFDDEVQAESSPSPPWASGVIEVVLPTARRTS